MVFAMRRHGCLSYSVRGLRCYCGGLLTIISVNDVEYGRSVSLTKQGARNDAARQALKSLGWSI